jgi:PPOX class probable F420-dependent enzyme
MELPVEYHDLLNAASTAVFTTLQRDGSPNSSSVWFWFDGQRITVSTLAERAKHRNVSRDPRVSFTVVDPERPLRYLEVRGVVTVEADPEGRTRDRIAAKHGYAERVGLRPTELDQSRLPAGTDPHHRALS